MDQTHNRRGAKTFRERSIHPGDWQSIFVELSPGLLMTVEQDGNHGIGSDQVLARQSRAVEKDELFGLNASANQEAAQNFQAALNRARRAFLFAQQAQHQLGVQVLAHLINDPQVLCERLRLIAGQHQRRGIGRPSGVATARSHGGDAECLRGCKFRVMSSRKSLAAKSAGSSMASASPKPGSSCGMLPQKVSWLEPGSRLMDTVRGPVPCGVVITRLSIL